MGLLKETKMSDPEKETDPMTLQRREKQIEYGKVKAEYDAYREKVPINERKWWHPKTPQKDQIASRRAFDGQIQVWKKRIHFWDDPEKCQAITPNSKQSKSAKKRGHKSNTESEATRNKKPKKEDQRDSTK